MRFLFLAACVLVGVTAGLWWTGYSSDRLTQPNQSTSASNNSAFLTADDAASNSSLAQQDDGSLEATATATAPVPAPAPSTEISRPFSYRDGIMRVAPAVVSVYAGEPASGNDLTLTSQGSGVIVDSEGIILTNLHLVNDFAAITVVLGDGRRYPATLIGSDVETDLAVVRIKANSLPFMTLDEAQPLEVGDIVLAIGNPFGVGQTVTQGIVSATRRRIANGTVWQNFIQIDAAINPGNSGGALINPLGQLVGVTTAVFRGETGAIGIGFAIPADLLSQVVPQIIENGTVSRGWLGLGVDDINMFPALAALTQHGAVITAVQEGGPAQLSGVRPMDVVVQLGEQSITSATQLLLSVSALPPGATVKLVLLRHPDAQTQTRIDDLQPLQEMIYKVRLGTRPTVARTPPR